MNEIVKIKRMTMRGGDDKFMITVGDTTIVIQPNKVQRYDIVSLLHGGPGESVELPAEVSER